MLTTPTMWEIAGVLSISPFESGTDIYMLSKETGFSVQTILQTLEKSHHFFEVGGYRDDRPELGLQYKWDIGIKLLVQQFLLDESRSRILYFAYRSSAIRAVRSNLMGQLKSGYARPVY